ASVVAMAAGGFMAACGGGGDDGASTPAAAPASEPVGPGVYDSALSFDKTRYTTITVTLDGVSTPVRWYREVCYVGKPMKLAPTQSAGADIVNGGTYVSTSDTDKRGAALSRGFVYINMASRSRGAMAPAGVYNDGIYQGKAPAAIVDAKAAVRYLRLNDSLMPGNANRIVVNGTSGGGAQSTQLGATGDSADYFPYLKAAGAAGIDANGKSSISDSVYAIVAYCPIQDMGSADLAYEWMFNVLDTRALVSADQKAGLIVDANGVELVRASNPDAAGSSEMMNKFVAYQAGLGLKNDDGTPLTTDNMLAALQTEIKKAASAYVKSGKAIVAYNAFGSAAANGVAGGSGTLYYKNDFINTDS
ncbi:MAG: hypothetical protein ABUL50_03235, partial [Rhizobacter sp.]